MKLAIAQLKSVSSYSQSRFHNTPKLEKELADDYEKRTWIEKGHWASNNHMFIPPMAFANSLKEAAKYLSIQVPGKGKTTFTKHFEAGTLVIDPLELSVTKDTVEGEWIYANADGVRDSGTRVMRCFPVCREWEGTVKYHVLDDVITEDVFLKVLRTSGSLVGIGRFRPRKSGYYGRFEITDFQWQDLR